MKMIKVTTPFGIKEMTVLNWMEFGEQEAMRELKFAKATDPNPEHLKIKVELVEG